MDDVTETVTLTIQNDPETETMTFEEESGEEDVSLGLESVVTPIIEHIPFFREDQNSLLPEEEENRKTHMKEIETLARQYIQKMNEYVERYHFHIGKSEFLENQSKFLAGQLSRIKLWTTETPSKSSKLRNYQIVETIGRGGSSEVYKVKHRYLEILRAAKLFKRIKNEDENEIAIEEARKVINMPVHDNIVRVFDLDFVTTEIAGGVIEKRCVIIMELVDCTLKDRLVELRRTRRRMKLEEFFRIVGDILVGLKYIHLNQIIHRDLKPSNIGLILKSGNPNRSKILDFGISARLGEKQKRFGGSEGFIAPELLKNHKKVSYQSDIYSMGQLMKQMLFNYDVLELPIELVSLIHKCCEVELEKRYRTVVDLLDDFSYCCFYEEGSELSKIRNYLLREKYKFTQFPNIWMKNYRGLEREKVIVEYDGLENDEKVPNEYSEKYEMKNDEDVGIKRLIALKEFKQEEDGTIRFILRNTTNQHFFKMSKIFQSLERSERVHHVRTKNSVFLNKFSVHIALISEDDKILFLRKEDGNFSCGVDRVFTVDDFCEGKKLVRKIDFFEFSVRALDQDLMIFDRDELRAAARHIFLTGLMCSNSNMEVGLVGFLDLRRVGNDVKKKSHELILSRKKEFQFHWIDVSVEKVVSFLQKHKDKVSKSALGCCVIALKSLYGTERMSHIIMKSLTTTKKETRKIKL